MGFCGPRRWAQWALSMGLPFFILLTEVGIQNALENGLIVTFHLRRFGCPPQLIQNARLEKYIL